MYHWQIEDNNYNTLIKSNSENQHQNEVTNNSLFLIKLLV